MDFAFTEEQEAVRQLAAQIFGDLSTHEKLKDAEATDDRFDRKLWSALADAGLLALALPEDAGGAGLGFLEACIVAEEAGRAAAAVPLAAVTVTGALPIARFGADALRAAWLPRLAAGDAIVVGALTEFGADPSRPVTTATPDGSAWRLQGTKANVEGAMVADAFVVAATTGAGVGLFLVEADAPGVTRRRQDTTDWHVEGELELRDVTVAADQVLVAPGPAGDEALRWVLERAAAALCVDVAGACQAALKLTAQYTSEREQFGKVIATFQAVGQRAADAYIDTEAVKLTAWQAVWRLANDLPASAEVATAKFWADDGAQRVVHAAQHLHGGVGVDRDYPLHRYYLRVKHLALTLGGATTSLLRLGDLLADAPV
jgi:acyl-CoA dehydrogenase